jgi:outer membrane protein OmpA-like peptidoglycan-associated protein
MSPHRPHVQTRPILTLALVLSALPSIAQALTLGFATPAVETGSMVDAPARHGFATGAFDGARVPMRIVDGALDQRAYRLDGVRDTTLALLLPLQAQIEAAGYTVVFDCETTGCGGFDFRFALDVLAEPQMHVDLGDFRYLAAQNDAGDMISLLVSKAADQGFVQVTSMIKGSAPLPPVTDPAEITPAPIPPPLPSAEPANSEPQPPTDPAPPAGPLAEALLATGSVALDDLVFASGKATLEDQDYPSLTALAAWLKANPALEVTLVGHTDASGSLEGNIALSRQRAAAVRERLMTKYDATPSQIDAQGAGYLAPRASNQTPEGRQKNRRVEVMLTSTPANAP